MQTKFKRHQKIKILRVPLEEDTEPYTNPPTQLKPGMSGEINIILPNGQYHIKIVDKTGKTIAYAAMDEESLKAI